MPTISSAVLAADRLACRFALVLEALALAWIGGRVAASPSAAGVDRLLALAAVTAASLVVAVAIHGRGVLGLGPDPRD